MTEIVSFGEWMQKRRNQLRYSRVALARQLGCAPVTIKKIERDERRPLLPPKPSSLPKYRDVPSIAANGRIPLTELGDPD